MAIKTDPVNFLVGQNSAVVVNPAQTDEMEIRGLQGMGLCLGFTMNTVEVSEMGRRIALDVPTGGKYEKTSVNYNFIPGDASLAYFRDASINSTKISKVRLYAVAGGDFSAPDLISDPASGLYVGTMGDAKVNSPGALYQGTLEYMPGGPFVLFIAHKKGAHLSYTSSTKTLASSDSDFVTAGFEAGDTLIIDNIPGKTGPMYFKASTVAAGAIVLDADEGDIDSLTADFTGTADTEVHGATPLTVSNL